MKANQIEYQGVTAESIRSKVETAEERKCNAEAAAATKIAEHLAKKLEQEMTRKGVKQIHLTDKQLISPKYFGLRGCWWCCHSGRSYERRSKLRQVLNILQEETAGFKILYDCKEKHEVYCIAVTDKPITNCGIQIW